MDCFLSVDLIINILVRLPVKSLCKFKCVSKNWLELITDPQFHSMHRELNMSNPNILVVKTTPIYMRKCTKVDICSLSFDGFCNNFEFSVHLNDEERYIEILPSKWNLICFMCKSGFYACNPSTQTMVKLPEISRYYPLSRHNAGMGYIQERDEYVLVHIFDKPDEEGYAVSGCEVLRLRDGMDCSWELMDAVSPLDVRDSGVLVENVFYWMNSEDSIENDEAIVSFDLGREEFSILSPPERSFDPYGSSCGLVELGERLCLVERATSQSSMDIWVLNDVENQNWVKEYSINMDGCIVPLDYWGGKILMIDLNRRSLFCYDTKKKKKYIKRKEHRRVKGEWNSLVLYTESFFSFGTKSTNLIGT